MITVYPDYCLKFSCIAGACRHTCCSGWEIDIDEISLQRFRSFPDIAPHIDFDAEIPHFQLHPNEDCPFLDSDGLCRMIISHGEAMLCDICADHPRFRNFFPDRTELGLGLCCEAAADLILSQTDPVRFIEELDPDPDCDPDEDERYILDFRTELIHIVQDRSKPFDRRMEDLLTAAECSMPSLTGKEAYDLLLSLERLDPAWESVILPLCDLDQLSIPSAPAAFDILLEQIAVYFLWRHIAAAWEFDDLSARVLLCVFLICLSANLLVSGTSENRADSVELLRMLSSELEYSDRNLQSLMDCLDR